MLILTYRVHRLGYDTYGHKMCLVYYVYVGVLIQMFINFVVTILSLYAHNLHFKTIAYLNVLKNYSENVLLVKFNLKN